MQFRTILIIFYVTETILALPNATKVINKCMMLSNNAAVEVDFILLTMLQSVDISMPNV